jgi:hypothetical protein
MASSKSAVSTIAIGMTALASTEGNKMMNFGYNGLWGLLILVGDIWAIINILQSASSNDKKLLWVVVVVLLPLIGLILWYFMGPRDGKTGN